MGRTLRRLFSYICKLSYPFGTLLPLTYWKTAMTSGQFKSF